MLKYTSSGTGWVIVHLALKLFQLQDNAIESPTCIILGKSLNLSSYQFIYLKTKFLRELQALTFYDSTGIFSFVSTPFHPPFIFLRSLFISLFIQSSI